MGMRAYHLFGAALAVVCKLQGAVPAGGGDARGGV